MNARVLKNGRCVVIAHAAAVLIRAANTHAANRKSGSAPYIGECLYNSLQFVKCFSLGSCFGPSKQKDKNFISSQRAPQCTQTPLLPRRAHGLRRQAALAGCGPGAAGGKAEVMRGGEMAAAALHHLLALETAYPGERPKPAPSLAAVRSFAKGAPAPTDPNEFERMVRRVMLSCSDSMSTKSLTRSFMRMACASSPRSTWAKALAACGATHEGRGAAGAAAETLCSSAVFSFCRRAIRLCEKGA